MSPSAASPAAAPPALPPRRAARASTLARAGLVAALVLGSGAVRHWQALRVDKYMAAGKESPFPLAEVPMELGTWTGVATELDARIVAATGSTDHVTRHYVDQRTGVALDVILLYGPTSDIFIHSPELCYPKAGYATGGDSSERAVPFAGGSAPFKSLAYRKGDAAQPEIQEVYYSWRYNGRWSTSVGSPKESERIPGMYKVQVARRITPSEARDVDNPIESFLATLIPDLEARITRPAPPPAPPAPKG